MTNQHGQSALYFAAQRQCTQTIQILIDAGADIDVTESLYYDLLRWRWREPNSYNGDYQNNAIVPHKPLPSSHETVRKRSQEPDLPKKELRGLSLREYRLEDVYIFVLLYTWGLVSIGRICGGGTVETGLLQEVKVEQNFKCDLSDCGENFQ